MPEPTHEYIKNQFRYALEEGRIEVFYQPVVRIISGKVCSLEALARWNDPDYGYLLPEQFVPLLEEYEQIHYLDCFVIREVCRQLRQAADAGESIVPVSVNLSTRDFELCDIFSIAEQSTADYEIPHEFIYFEITESLAAENSVLMHTVIERFQETGFQVWMDDFGSGYSSLNVLKDFRFNNLKIDMEFIHSIDPRSQRIVTSIIRMAKEIGIHTLAEGIETTEQYTFLHDIGCEKAQGFLFGRPMLYPDIIKHLKTAGMEPEPPSERPYYDQIGMTDILSAAPFSTYSDQDAKPVWRELNSIPLAVMEVRGDEWKLLFRNAAFDQSVSQIKFFRAFETECSHPQPLSIFPEVFKNAVEEALLIDRSHLVFISGEEYFDLTVKRTGSCKDAWTVLLSVRSISKAPDAVRTDALDQGMRQIYSIFERVILVDLNTNTLTPLYLSGRENHAPQNFDPKTINKIYAEEWIFPDDRDMYLRFLDFDDLEERIAASLHGYISEYVRKYIRNGNYGWKQLFLVSLAPGQILYLTRSAEDEMRNMKLRYGNEETESKFTPQLLWNNLVSSEISRIFWKDSERRFIGAGKGFMSYYGFTSPDEFVGKTDEELGWHIHPLPYQQDELSVIRNGISTKQVPGNCIAHGENRSISASKTPIYDDGGKIIGLLGHFTDIDAITKDIEEQISVNRRDVLSGLLNSRGIAEETINLHDEYLRHNVDFDRLHISIDNAAMLCGQYGENYGDRIIRAFGTYLKNEFGKETVLGRLSGFRFVMLYQFISPDHSASLLSRLKEAPKYIREIDGIPFTLYLSIGNAMFSDYQDLEEQARMADLRMHENRGSRNRSD